MRKSTSFEKNLENIDEIISNLENGNLSLEESIKEYEKAMKYIQTAKEILNTAEGKLIKISKDDDQIKMENFMEDEDA